MLYVCNFEHVGMCSVCKRQILLSVCIIIIVIIIIIIVIIIVIIIIIIIIINTIVKISCWLCLANVGHCRWTVRSEVDGNSAAGKTRYRYLSFTVSLSPEKLRLLSLLFTYFSALRHNIWSAYLSLPVAHLPLPMAHLSLPVAQRHCLLLTVAACCSHVSPPSIALSQDS